MGNLVDCLIIMSVATTMFVGAPIYYGFKSVKDLGHGVKVLFVHKEKNKDDLQKG